jgi:hypothetical protein
VSDATKDDHLAKLSASVKAQTGVTPDKIIKDGVLHVSDASLNPRPGDRVRHYKGGLYNVIAIAIDEATLASVVVYQEVSGSPFWVRTLENWRTPVKGLTPRFITIWNGRKP